MKADLPRVETVPWAWAALLLAACVLSSVAWAQDPNYLTSFDVTWYFDKPVTTDGAGDTYQYGTFANGDYYIVGDPNVVIERIYPPCEDVPYCVSYSGQYWQCVQDHTSSAADPLAGLDDPNWTDYWTAVTAEQWTYYFPIGWRGAWSGSSVKYYTGRIVNGSQVNPTMGTTQGYDEHLGYQPYITQGGFSAALNVADGVTDTSPLHLAPGSSLVSCISNTTPAPEVRLKGCSVLTVLASAPAANSFRPAYAGSDKTVQFTTADIDWDVLLSLAPVTGTPDINDITADFERVWLQQLEDWMNQFTSPTDNMSQYGREFQEDVGNGILSLHLNYTQEQKTSLAIGVIQVGIDLYGCLQADAGTDAWDPSGGHMGGRKLPILFAGIMLNDASMKAIGDKSGAYATNGESYPPNPPGDYIGFGEDGQTFYVTQAEVDMTASGDWNPYPLPGEAYTAEDIGMAEWSIGWAYNLKNVNKAANANYRTTVGCTLDGYVLAALMTAGAKTLWNNDALFDYMDRYVNTEEWYQSNTFFINMWDTYWVTYQNGVEADGVRYFLGGP